MKVTKKVMITIDRQLIDEPQTTPLEEADRLVRQLGEERQALERRNAELVAEVSRLRKVEAELRARDKTLRAIEDHIGNGPNSPDGAEVIRQLGRSLDELKMAKQELEALAYSVSHDLRAPLRAMKGYSDALVEEYVSVLDDQGVYYLERLQTSANRMDAMILDLLTLSRLMHAAPVFRPVDLSEKAHTIAVELQARAPERTVEWVIQNDVAVEGDEHLLQVALRHLLENAFKFTAPNKWTRIEFCRIGNQGARAYCVRDNGVGFQMNYASKLFAPFQRLHSEQEFPGAGIGLATVARIVHRHGGRIWCEAEVNQGAAFFFTLGKPG
jgi:light-regulated signal transduction histidine kinase (bacteriophytochrome)